jgi:F-type H+-transporting ATPase subunit b
MLRARVRLAVSLAALLVAVVDVRAADDHKHPATSKYKVTYDKDGKHVDETFDLSNEGKAKELTALLKEGKVHELAPDKGPPNLMALAFDLGLWTIVVFLLLYAILKKKAWGPMLEGLQKREENILNALSEAKKANEEAQTLRVQLQKDHDSAAQKVAEMLEKARRDSEQAFNEKMKKADAEIQEKRNRVLREVETAKDQALQELLHTQAQLATLISAKTIRKNLTVDDHRQQVDEALADMKTAAAGGGRFLRGQTS